VQEEVAELWNGNSFVAAVLAANVMLPRRQCQPAIGTRGNFAAAFEHLKEFACYFRVFGTPVVNLGEFLV
jgi:hypothetical protein